MVVGVHAARPPEAVRGPLDHLGGRRVDVHLVLDGADGPLGALLLDVLPMESILTINVGTAARAS